MSKSVDKRLAAQIPEYSALLSRHDVLLNKYDALFTLCVRHLHYHSLGLAVTADDCELCRQVAFENPKKELDQFYGRAQNDET